MLVKDVGEFRLIETLAETIAEENSGLIARLAERGFRLRLAIGDDAAAWDEPSGLRVMTTDTMVEGVHFNLSQIGWRDLGWKALAVNVSDIAAMGGLPLYALVTLGLQPETNVEDIHALYRGMLSACHEYQCRIVGGDMVRSPVTFITVALTGIARGPVLTRHSAQPGDVVAVTGPLGCAAGGLQTLLRGTALEGEQGGHLHKAHSHPVPRLQAGQVLVQHGVQAAMDISDGLTDDLSKMCVSRRLTTNATASATASIIIMVMLVW